MADYGPADQEVCRHFTAQAKFGGEKADIQ
jgi:hypothetical protein